MNKRKLAIFLCSISALSSCNGYSISNEEAKNIIEIINASLANNEISYDKFCYTYQEDNNGAVTTTKTIYDKQNHFYNSYTFTPLGKVNDEYYYDVHEEWQYVKTNADGSSTLYNVTKDNNDKMNYTTNEVEWESVEKKAVKEINRYLSSSLIIMLEMINSDKDVSLSSLNDRSIYLSYEKTEFNIEDNYLLNFTQTNNELNKSIAVNYSRVTINYPILS